MFDRGLSGLKKLKSKRLGTFRHSKTIMEIQSGLPSAFSGGGGKSTTDLANTEKSDIDKRRFLLNMEKLRHKHKLVEQRRKSVMPRVRETGIQLRDNSKAHLHTSFMLTNEKSKRELRLELLKISTKKVGGANESSEDRGISWERY